MKSKVKVRIVLAVCLLLVVVFAVVHNTTRTKVPEHNIAVKSGETIKYVDIDKLKLTKVTGQIKNKKGEVKDISGEGILVRDVLAEVELTTFTTLQVCAADEYNCIMERYEVMDTDDAYFLISDSKVRLYVFSDENSKRNVSNVTLIKVE